MKPERAFHAQDMVGARTYLAVCSTPPFHATGHISAANSQQDEAQSEAVIGEIRSAGDILAARQLVGCVYMHEGYIQELTEDGSLTEADDPYHACSTYFAVKRNGEIVATCRLLQFQTITEFPAIKVFGVDCAALPDNGIDAHQYIEVSSLGKKPKAAQVGDVAQLYGSMMRWSYDRGIKQWLASGDTAFLRGFGILFGHGLMKQIGAAKTYLGSETTPMIIDMAHAVLTFYHARAENRGTPAQVLVREAFLRGWEQRDEVLAPMTIPREGHYPPQGYRRLFTGKNLAKIGLVFYTLARASIIPLTSLTQHGVNPLLFFGFDVGTVYPYVEGIDWVTDKKSSFIRKVGGFALAAASFVAPYVYVGVEAHQAPHFPEAMGMFAGTVVGAYAVRKCLSQVKALWRKRASAFRRFHRPAEKRPVDQGKASVVQGGDEQSAESM